MSKTDLSLNGLMGAVEVVVETAKRLQDHEERYQVNAEAFGRIEQQFQQIHETAGQLQSLTEERLASLSALSVELKARHSQGGEILAEVKGLVEDLREQQAKFDQNRAGVEGRQQAEQTAQLSQTVHVLGTLLEQLQGRQSQLEQSLLALDSLQRDLSKRSTEWESQWHSLRHLAEDVTERQEQTEKTLSGVQAAQQAEKGLLSQFEKSLQTVRSTALELEKRQAQTELTLSAIKATGGDATLINLQSVDVVRGLMQDLGERQATLQALVAEVQQRAERAAEQAARLDESLAKTEKTGAQALAEAQSAEAKAAEALERIARPAEWGVAAAAATSENHEQAAAEFRQWLERREAEHKAALEALPAQSETAIEKFLDENRQRLAQMWSVWFQQREEKVAEMENRYRKIAEKAAAAPGSSPAQGWGEEMASAVNTHSSELRFVRTLLWITLAAVALAYALVAYAVVARSG